MLQAAITKIKRSDFAEKVIGIWKSVMLFFQIIYLMLTSNDINTFVKLITKLKNYQGISGRVDVSNINYREGYFNTNSNIYNSSDYWFEDIYIDKKAWFMKRNGIIPDGNVKINILREWWEDQVNEIVSNYFTISDWDSYYVYSGNNEDNGFELFSYTFDELEEEYPQIYDDIIEMIEWEVDKLDFWDLENEGILQELYDIRWPEETFNEYEMLAYWTNYFEPDWWDEEIAWKVGLYPFEFKEDNYLALGGCGMDLSPKLDAYQALASGSLPKSSRFEDDPKYAKYVVGESIYKQVMEAVKESLTITIKTWN
ncbi:MAG: hypothetical protein ACOCRK_07370 [bacterium]